jgi:hypothetical protein
MFEDVRKAIGANWFRAFVVAFGCLWVWHSFFSSVGEQADATIKQATAQQALRRQIAEADEAVARARKAEAEAETANTRGRPLSFQKPAEVDSGTKPETQLQRAVRIYSELCDQETRRIVKQRGYDYASMRIMEERGCGKRADGLP